MFETTWGCEQKVRPVGLYIAAQVHYVVIKKKRTTWRTKNKADVKSAFPFHLILFLLEKMRKLIPDQTPLLSHAWYEPRVQHEEHLMGWANVLTSLWQKHTLMCIITQNKCREPLNRVKIVPLCSQWGQVQHLSWFRRKVLVSDSWREPEELVPNSAPLSLSVFDLRLSSVKKKKNNPPMSPNNIMCTFTIYCTLIYNTINKSW